MRAKAFIRRTHSQANLVAVSQAIEFRPEVTPEEQVALGVAGARVLVDRS
jgi:hypothetical protein